LWGSAVHHCPHCHGYEVRDQEILVVGGAMPQVTLHQAALLRRYSDRVTLCPNGMDVPGTERARLQAFGVDIVGGAVARLVTDDAKLKAAELADGGLVSADAVFIAPRPRPNDAVLRGLGCTIDPDTGWVITDRTGATTVSGVWATGNVTNPRAQVITAAGEASHRGDRDHRLDARPGRDRRRALHLWRRVRPRLSMIKIDR
jgi:thioredoxin reductase (NADPH)